MVDLSFYKSWLAEEIRDEGHIQIGIEDVLIVLEARGIHVPNEIRERITSCTDPALLDTWLIRAATATSITELFAEDDA